MEKEINKENIKEFIIVSLNISERTGTKKTPVEKITLVEEKGVLGDAHFNKLFDRQVSLLSYEDIDTMNEKLKNRNSENKNIVFSPGDFAENITLKNIDLKKLKIGQRLFIGPAILEISKIGKECHSDCEIKKISGDCIMPKNGVFAKVIKGGEIEIKSPCYYCIRQSI